MANVAIIGLGWLGLPLAQALRERGDTVVGSKTTEEGVKAARLSGVACYPLQLTPVLQANQDDLAALFADTETLIITVPVSALPDGAAYRQAIQALADQALSQAVPRLIFTSSISVYGRATGRVTERTPLRPQHASGQTLRDVEQWLHCLPHCTVTVLRLAGLVGPNRHPGRFLAGRNGLPDGDARVNLVHLDDVISAIRHLLDQPQAQGGCYNLCAPQHPIRREFYVRQARRLGLPAPQFAASAPSREPAMWIDGERICQATGFAYRYRDPYAMTPGEDGY